MEMPAAGSLVPFSLGQLIRYFLGLGTFGFGGPIALAGYMQRDLVENRRWFARSDYVEGLALAQLAPGPLAAQLAIYLGWLRGRVLGATLIGLAFVMPSFLMVLVLSALYLRFGGLPWMQGAFYGVGAAVVAIIARSATKLARLTLGKDWLRWSISGLMAVVTAWTETEVVWLFLASGFLVWAIRTSRGFPGGAAAALAPQWGWLVTGLHGSASLPQLVRIGLYFAEAGAFVFGSGLAIVPFLHGGVVNQFGWLTERQFLDAVAVAMVTPGPVVITVAFIGYLVAGPVGASIAALGVFLPCWLFVIIPAPYFRRHGQRPGIKAFVDGVTAAATGAIAGAAIILARRAVFDVGTAVVAVMALAAMLKLHRVPEPLLILAAGLVGIVLKAVRP
jgi:chromate transporter